MEQSFRTQWRRAAWLMAGFCLMGQVGIAAEARSLYAYTDAQGQAVLTDNLQQVPAEYRGRLRTVSGGESPAAEAITPGAASEVENLPSPSGVVQKLLHLVAQKVSPITGLTPHQTAVVIVAGACVAALLLLLFLSSNPAIRILAKCLLILVSLAALYQMTVGGAVSIGAVAGTAPQPSRQAMDNLMEQVKNKTEQSYRLQDERTTRQLDQVEQPTQ
jgi:hypothetical protein